MDFKHQRVYMGQFGKMLRPKDRTPQRGSNK